MACPTERSLDGINKSMEPPAKKSKCDINAEDQGFQKQISEEASTCCSGSAVTSAFSDSDSEESPQLKVEGVRPTDKQQWGMLYAHLLGNPAEFKNTCDRTWTRILEDESLHTLVARKGEKLVGAVHFFADADASGKAVCYIAALYTSSLKCSDSATRVLMDGVRTWEGNKSGKVYFIQSTDATAH